MGWECRGKSRRRIVWVTRVMVMGVLEKRRNCRPKPRWMDSIKDDLAVKGLLGEEGQDYRASQR